MREVDLMRSLPQSRRDVGARSAGRTRENVEIACRFGREYFDGTREQGYGGYRYDGRWVPVAADIVTHFGLRPGDRVLDVGCAKGFLVKDLLACGAGVDAFGIDVSEYALLHCEPEVVGRLHLGSADRLPFPDASFAAVIAKDVLHNLDRERCLRAVREVERLAPGRGYIQVDSYRTPEEREAFLRWVLTAKTHFEPAGWLELFREAGYTGDYAWTLIA